MSITDHLGRRLAALALVGGTATALFTGAAAQTQFSATSSQQTATPNGGTVKLAVGGGTFTCSNLIPPNNAQDPITGNTYTGTNCQRTITFYNQGSTTETFTLNVGTITGWINTGSGIASWKQGDKSGYSGDMLRQLVTSFVVNSGTPTTETFYSGESIPVAQIPVGGNLSVTVTFSLAADTSNATEQNYWNGGSMSIPYTVTAEPSA